MARVRAAKAYTSTINNNEKRDEVELAATAGHGIHGEDDGGLIVVFFFERHFQFSGKLFAGLRLGIKPANVGHLQFA